MIILPMGPIIFYIQPVYLEATSRLKIPELKRLIVSQGDAVVMAPSLGEAFRLLEKQVAEKIEDDTRNFPLETPRLQHKTHLKKDTGTD